jgi:hypothetical protein
MHWHKFLLLGLSVCNLTIAELPDKFLGEWLTKIDKSSEFPWWRQIVYPVKLSATQGGIVFEDQRGFKCTPETFFYDTQLDALIFKGCHPTKSKLAFSPFYRVKLDNGHIYGETWTYKALFQWKGYKITPSASSINKHLKINSQSDK